MRSQISLAAATIAIAALGHSANAATLIHTVNVIGPDAAAIQGDVDTFRTILGPLNANDPVNGDPNGRRQIDWDAAPDAVSDPNPFPGDFFNFNANPRARGIEFTPSGTTTGFQLSSTAASGEPVLFGDDGSDFQTFSPERLFTPVDGTTFTVSFFDPSDQVTPATVRGLGVVFVDVEFVDSTTMTFFDVNNNVLDTISVANSATSGQLSFAGVIFDDPVIASVAIQSGTNVFDGNAFPTAVLDGVVMDDFIFGEPIAQVPLPATLWLMLGGMGLAASALRRRA